jgi:hypothetical protein
MGIPPWNTGLFEPRESRGCRPERRRPPSRKSDSTCHHGRRGVWLRNTCCEIPFAVAMGRRYRQARPTAKGSRSFTARVRFCLHPMYRSVVWTEACPKRNWICSSSPPAAWHRRAQVLRRSWGARGDSDAGRTGLDDIPDDVLGDSVAPYYSVLSD